MSPPRTIPATAQRGKPAQRAVRRKRLLWAFRGNSTEVTRSNIVLSGGACRSGLSPAVKACKGPLPRVFAVLPCSCSRNPSAGGIGRSSASEVACEALLCSNTCVITCTVKYTIAYYSDAVADDILPFPRPLLRATSC